MSTDLGNRGLQLAAYYRPMILSDQARATRQRLARSHGRFGRKVVDTTSAWFTLGKGYGW